MRQRAVDQIDEHGFDHGMVAVGEVGVDDRFGRVGEERVIPPDREQFVLTSRIADTAHDQPGGHSARLGPKSGIRNLGDFGIGNPCPGIRILHRTRIPHRDPHIIGNRRDRALRGPVLVNTSENRAPPRRQVAMTARPPNAESPRTRISPVTPAPRAQVMACATIRAAPLADPALPARSLIPAITGADTSVLIVAASDERPLCRIGLPDTLLSLCGFG